MESPACLACTLETGGKLTFLDTQHTCIKNPYISPNTIYTANELSDGTEDAGSTASAYTFDNYQDDAGLTAIYPDAGTGSFDAITYVVLGLSGEAGEIANKWKKALRDIPKEYRNSDAYIVAVYGIKTAILDEIGDVLWYAARTVEELGTSASLGEVAATNTRKLSDRKTRDVLRGSGDER